MNLTFPLNHTVAYQLLEEKMIETLATLERQTRRPMPFPILEIKPRMGHTAGRADYRRNKILMNSDWFNNEWMWNEALNNTLPHEVCHHVAKAIYTPHIHGHDRLAGRGHGQLWKRCMTLVGLEPKRCYKSNPEIDELVRIRKVSKKYLYTCGCNTKFHFTAIKHNRIQKGQGRRCIKCKGRVSFVGLTE